MSDSAILVDKQRWICYEHVIRSELPSRSTFDGNEIIIKRDRRYLLAEVNVEIRRGCDELLQQSLAARLRHKKRQ